MGVARQGLEGASLLLAIPEWISLQSKGGSYNLRKAMSLISLVPGRDAAGSQQTYLEVWP